MCTHNWFCAKHFEKYSHHPSQRILFDALRNIVIAYVFFTRNLANQFCQVNSSWCWKLYSSDFKMKKLIQNWVLLIVLQTLTLGHIHLRIDFMSSVTFLVQSVIESHSQIMPSHSWSGWWLFCLGTRGFSWQWSSFWLR